MDEMTGRPQPAPGKRAARAAWAKTFEPVLAELRDQIRGREPRRTAAASGAAWDAAANEFGLRCMGREYRVTWPALVAWPAGRAEPCAAHLQGLILYYLAIADGVPPAGRWIAFRELPDGWLYHQAFQGYTGDELVRALGNDIAGFRLAAEQAGGWPIGTGDAGYAFDVLPRLRLAVVYWLGDDEFPPGAQVLFDASASHYLTTDGLAVLGHHVMHWLLDGVGKAASDR